MAARRLIAILVVLLLISSFAAALVPAPPGEETTSSTTASPTSDDPPPGDDLIEETIEAEPDQPIEIELQRGDRLQLTVEVAEPTQVQIPGLGQDAFATPQAPATFDLLLRSSGKYAVTINNGTAVARLLVGG